MDRIRELHKSRSSTNKIGGNHKEKSTSRLASPNVVARLMGLEGLPSPEVIHRSQHAHADNNEKIALSKMSQRDAHWREPWSYKKSYVEQSEFKDVFEDTVNKSGSNRDSAMEVFHQSDSHFLEHRHMQKSPSSYGYNRIAVLKPSNSANQKAKAKSRKDEKGSPIKDGHVRHTCNNYGSQSLIEASIRSSDGKAESDIMAKRIVILKPNYVKSQNAFNSFSSPDSSQFDFSVVSDREQYRDCSRAEYYRNMNIFKDVDFSRHKSREVTETVKKATREMRDTYTYSRMKNRRDTAKEFKGEMVEDFGYMINNFPSPCSGSPDIRGLYDFSENVSASELEEKKVNSYDFTESFLSSEAKKRLLERLKKAYKYQDVVVNSKGSIKMDINQDAGIDGKKITLGEMLSTSDKKFRNLDVAMGGISSKDGWKHSYSKFSSRSRSICQLPGMASEKHNVDSEYRVDDKLLVPKEDAYLYQRKVLDRNCKKKENSTSKNSRSSKRKSQSDRQRCAYKNDCLLESYSSQDRTETNLNKEGSPDKQLLVPQTSENAASIVDAADIIQHGSRTLSPRSSDELPPERLIFVKNGDDSSLGNQEDSTQHTKAEAESSESSKEADHPSPVSVLQVPPREDDVLSGPESFEQVSADLRELQKQLQLLRRESKSDEMDSTPLDNDYDIQQGSVVDYESRRVHKPECWESSYVVDVLIESGFDDTDANMFTAICYSPDYPLGPWVFDNLERKHYGEVTGSKHDRRLLFDRINSALSLMSKSFEEPCPWVRPSTVGIRFRWQACDIRDELYKLLEGQVKEANEEDSEKLLDKEMNWVGSRDSIDAIGIEIEKLLTDELLTELLKDVNCKVPKLEWV